jgi:hypothetical protein
LLTIGGNDARITIEDVVRGPFPDNPINVKFGALSSVRSVERVSTEITYAISNPIADIHQTPAFYIRIMV